MVKCADCGFLASRNVDTRELEETEKRIREDGWRERIYADKTKTFHELGTDYYRYEPPCCLVGAFDLRKETGNHTEATEKSIKDCIQVSRPCKDIVKWRLGFAPKEHWEMMERNEERKLRIIEVVIVTFVSLVGMMGSAIIGALIAQGKFP